MEPKSPPWGWSCLAWHPLPRVSPVLWDAPWEGEAGGGQAPCHPRQGLKYQSHSSQVGTSSREPRGRISVFWKDVSIWEIWIWQSLGIFKRWGCNGISFFLLKELGCQLCLINDASLAPPEPLQYGFLVLLWAHGPFNANPVSVLKWAVLHCLAEWERSGLWTKLIQNIYSIIDCWHDVLFLQRSVCKWNKHLKITVLYAVLATKRITKYWD